MKLETKLRRQIVALVDALELASRELDRLGATDNDATAGPNLVVKRVRALLKKHGRKP